MGPKGAIDPAKQDSIVPCECRKVYIGETGRPMQDRIKEHCRDIRFVRTTTSTVSPFRNTIYKPLWNEVKCIDRDPHYCKCRVNEAIHSRLHPDNIWGWRNKHFRNVECPRSKNTNNESRATVDRRGSKSLSETARIEMRQLELLKTDQSQQSVIHYKITHDQSTSSSE